MFIKKQHILAKIQIFFKQNREAKFLSYCSKAFI